MHHSNTPLYYFNEKTNTLYRRNDGASNRLPDEELGENGWHPGPGALAEWGNDGYVDFDPERSIVPEGTGSLLDDCTRITVEEALRLAETLQLPTWGWTEFDSIRLDGAIWRDRAYGQVTVGDLLVHTYNARYRARGGLGDFDPVRDSEKVVMVGSIAYHFGMALELALKGRIIDKTKRFPDRPHHELEKYCREAGLSPSEAEKDLLERLSAAIAWWGRYSVPKNEEEWDKAKATNLRRLALPEDRHTLERLLKRLGVRFPTQ